MTDEEQLLAARLHHPFTDADLAVNRGPISDREFNRKLLFLSGYGKLTRVANSVRRPNITIAMLALSFVPPTLSYVITRDMDGLTNVLATLMGGVGTSPLLLNVFMPSQATPKTYWWVYALNLSQLVRLDEFIAKNAVSSEAIHLHLAHRAIQDRIRQLRSIRYASNGVKGLR